MNERLFTTADGVRAVLRNVSFAPSCVDMAWDWEVAGTYTDVGSGFLIRTTFQRPDRDTGQIEKGYGRWWHISFARTPDGRSGASESAIVKTAYKAALLILEHELMESFRYEGFRLFDPHHDVDDLKAAAQHRRGKA